MVVKPNAKVKGPMRLETVPGGSYAVTEHAGPYENMGATYAALCARVASGPVEGIAWDLADPPSVERYLNDPRKTKPEELRTEIWFPVTRAG